MVNAYSPSSFTKNFGWEADYKPLYHAVRSGFGHRAVPTRIETWRARSGLPDRDRELIPLRFFLCSRTDSEGDYVLPDEFVCRCLAGPYTLDVGLLSLFAFHVARSGKWRGSKWPGGRVAGWAREYICKYAWNDGAWQREAFTDVTLENYVGDIIHGKTETLHKVFTNYRHMLRIAGILQPGMDIGPIPFSAGGWAESACKLFWDRAIYSNEIEETASETELLGFFLLNEGFKLLGSGTEQGRVIASLAAADYRRDGGIYRFS